VRIVVISISNTKGISTVNDQPMLSIADIMQLLRQVNFGPAMKQATDDLGRVRILISGKSGVGKTTLINAMFGQEMGEVGSGRPVSQEVQWHEFDGNPLALCDTRGLELADYKATIEAVEREFEARDKNADVRERIHLAWICIAEPSGRVEPGEIELFNLCKKYDVPCIVVLTKGIGSDEFVDEVRKLLVDATGYVRVLAETWKSGRLVVEPYGLDGLLAETLEAVPSAMRKALIAAQKVDLDLKRRGALIVARAAAIAAASGTAVPVPLAGMGAFVAANVGMLVKIAAVMGVELSTSTVFAIATSAIAGLGLSFGVKMGLGELMKLVPGVGSVGGTVVEAGTTLAATYGLGHGFTEFLLWFSQINHRLPEADEIVQGFREYWRRLPNKVIKPEVQEA
jgi:uncharacterized protein (DUF697 family)/GTP-binding protein EngB required for normal cell division